MKNSRLFYVVLISIVVIIVTLGLNILKPKKSPIIPPPSSTIVQEPHPVRMGLQMTRHSISDNIKLLQTFQKKKKTYKLLEKMPHNVSLFTQGLVFKDGHLIESTGLYGKSEVIGFTDQRNNNHRFLQSTILPKKYFGEGITVFGDNQLIQLTWQEETAFIYQLPSPTSSLNSLPISPIDEFQYQTYTGEGWGITYDKYKQELIVSDGSEYLYFWDPITFKELRYIRVTLPPCLHHHHHHLQVEEEEDAPTTAQVEVEEVDVYCQPASRSGGEGVVQLPIRYLKFLNELEYSSKEGYVLANVWYANELVLIELSTGQVTEVYDFNQLHTKRGKKEVCRNNDALSVVR